SALFCFADMTIYLKNGGQHQVHKIVFKGNQAELYLLDGTLLKLPVSAIDLEGSGIGSPVGTYGETKITGRKTTFQRGIPVTDSEHRQAELRAQWEQASITAKALTNLGAIRAGQIVHAYLPGTQPAPSTKQTPGGVQRYYSDYNPDYPDDDPVSPDQAYVILYKNPDGTFGKKIVDTITFNANFEIQKAQQISPPTVTLPAAVPPVDTKEQPEPTSPPVAEPKPDTGQGDQQPEESQQEAEESAASSGSDRPLLPLLFVLAGVLLAVGAAVFLLKKRPKPFVDPSKFARYEQDLKEFELEIWLKHGKTTDQLMEICLKKFYQDFPAALNINMKMLKSEPKNWIIPILLKQSEKSPAEVEALYNDFLHRQDRIRRLIQEVSNRTGLQPVRMTTADGTGPTVKVETRQAQPPRMKTPETPLASIPSAANKPAEPASGSASGTSSVQMPVAQVNLPSEPFPLQQSEVKKSASAFSEMPPYAAVVLSQLALLSAREED
ncbi:MAG TPA: hypothetical protein VI958_08490, partial [Acidobacteriota bacterium]